MFESARHAAEKLLGVPLPESAEDLHFFRHQPSPDLILCTWYLTFSASREAFADLVRRMGMHLHGTGGEALRYLPAAWAAEPELNLSWWDPDRNTPRDSAAKSFGVNGWIVAKHERGRVYLIATDAGHESGTPGPW